MRIDGRKKICIVSPGLLGGGAERVTSIIANYLSDRDFNVSVICTYYREVEYDVNNNVKLLFVTSDHRNPLRRLIDRNLQILKYVKKNNADVVIELDVECEMIMTMLAGYRLLASLRNDPSHYRGAKKILQKIVFVNSASVVFQTEGAKSLFSKRIKKRGIVIPNPVDTKKLPHWNSHNNSRDFIVACRLNPQKNLSMLIDAFFIVHKMEPEYRLLIYGEGELRDILQQKIINLQLQNTVILKGRSHNIYDIMAESFAFISSSDYEGLSNSMLEALCIGIPCICTDCPPGGPREYIKHEINGQLVKVSDSEDMANSIIYMIRNDGCRINYCKKSAWIREKLSIENIGMKWEEAINNVL